jgi:hypothetical protein
MTLFKALLGLACCARRCGHRGVRRRNDPRGGHPRAGGDGGPKGLHTPALPRQRSPTGSRNASRHEPVPRGGRVRSVEPVFRWAGPTTTSLGMSYPVSTRRTVEGAMPRIEANRAGQAADHAVAPRSGPLSVSRYALDRGAAGSNDPSKRRLPRCGSAPATVCSRRDISSRLPRAVPDDPVNTRSARRWRVQVTRGA